MTSSLFDPAWDIRCELRAMTLCFSNCQRKLSSTSQLEIVESLHAGMADYNIQQYFQRQPTIFSDYDLLVVAGAPPENRPIGVLGGRWFDVKGQHTLYMWTAFIADAYRGTHLFKRMLALLMGAGCDPDPDLVCLKTFSPKVYEAVARLHHMLVPLGVRLYPQIPPTTTQDPELTSLAQRSMELMFPKLKFMPDTGLVLGGQQSVGIEVFPGMPKAANPAVMQYFERYVSAADQIFVLLDTSHVKGLGRQLCGMIAPEIVASLPKRNPA